MHKVFYLDLFTNSYHCCIAAVLSYHYWLFGISCHKSCIVFSAMIELYCITRSELESDTGGRRKAYHIQEVSPSFPEPLSIYQSLFSVTYSLTSYTVDFSSLWTLKLYTVSISLTSISGSDRFVADKSCSWVNCITNVELNYERRTRLTELKSTVIHEVFNTLSSCWIICGVRYR